MRADNDRMLLLTFVASDTTPQPEPCRPLGDPSLLLIEHRLAAAGVDVDKLEVQRVGDGILYFAPGSGAEHLRSVIARGIKDGTLNADDVSSFYHPGRSDFGARDHRLSSSLQIGVGPDGGFADIDLFNPFVSPVGFVGHTLELLWPGKTDPVSLARIANEASVVCKTP